VSGAVPDQALEEQLRGRGLVLLGACEGLSKRPEILQSPLLRDFSAPELDQLGASMMLIRAQPGQLLIAEDESSDWMMLLMRGTVDVGKRKIGTGTGLDSDEPVENTRLAVLKEGAVLGEMSMLDGEPRYASCWALSEVEAAVLSRAAVGGLIRTQPAVGAKLLVKLTQLLAQRLRNTSSQLVKALQKNAG
jgi:CRP/FNR family transcriptional regulator, cyclic AMP receptor protein